MPKVSVLICTYNSGNYIFDTIKCVLNQTYSNLELLIVDNNSKDETVKNIKSFNDTRIKIFESNVNLGAYGGINFLLEKASGDYMAILDHDDLWTGNKLEKQVNFLENNKEFIGCGTETVMYYESDKKYFLYYLKKKNYYTVHPSLLFRKGDYRYDLEILYFSDAYFQKFALCKGQKLIYNVKEPLTYHLIKDGFNNLTYSWFKINAKNIKRVFEIHGITLYAFSALGYELSRYFLVRFKIVRILPKFFKWFDRLPYKFVGGEFRDFETDDLKKVFFK
ncbi:MAG: glycosyltransferase family 2 protein [Candidatus Gracilibacteria bacterium]|nr:glycosyltransferase family 2 protein [Candidatus Gracilibacteria bacterium]